MLNPWHSSHRGVSGSGTPEKKSGPTRIAGSQACRALTARPRLRLGLSAIASVRRSLRLSPRKRPRLRSASGGALGLVPWEIIPRWEDVTSCPAAPVVRRARMRLRSYP